VTRGGGEVLVLEEGEQRGQVGRPVVAEDADVDCEGVGAQGEGVAAGGGCDCFAELPQRCQYC
jgi:hypothetical protein